MNMSVGAIEIDVTPECGLVLQQAGQSVLRGVCVKNAGEESLVGMKLVISSDIGLFRPLDISLATVQPGETVSVPIPEGEPRLDYGILSTLADVKDFVADMVYSDDTIFLEIGNKVDAGVKMREALTALRSSGRPYSSAICRMAST